MPEYNKAFDEAVTFTLVWEGGYVNDPTDRGGETNWGISKRAYPHLIIPKLTIDQAIEIYHEDYWLPTGGDALGHPLGLVVFDYAVNSGVRTSSAALQRAIGATPDGRVGPGTLRALRDRLARGWPMGPQALSVKVLEARVEMLCAMVKARPTQAKFLHGWMRRTHEIAERIWV